MGAQAGPLVREECRAAPDRTYYSGWSWGLGSLASCGHVVRSASLHSEQSRPDERFDLIKLDCDCVSRAR